MLKASPLFLIFLMLIFAVRAGAYERNVAMPVDKVVYGEVQSVRNVTQQQLIQDHNQGWKTFGGAVLGGVIGHQFGGGSGQDVATVLGSLMGAAIAANSARDQIVQYQLVELLIALEDGEQVMVLQDMDPRVTYQPGEEVRVVYFSNHVRVDPAM